jgi:hypothetical protein
MDWPEPWKVKDIQSFLRFANFNRCFIFNYLDIIVSLTGLTRKDVPWNFSENCCLTFEALKTAFTSAPILTYWMPNVPIVVETDTSDYAIARILSIVCLDEELHPVAFYSRTLMALELNYDTHDKKLVIFEAFHSWRHYCKGSAELIDVVTGRVRFRYKI